MNLLKNKATFETFFKLHYDALCRFAYCYVKDSDEAEEIVQNCFVRLWEEKQIRIIEVSSKAYLYTSVRNASLNHIKHIRIKSDYQSYRKHNRDFYRNETEDEIEGNELQERITIAIAKMPEKRQAVFNLSRIEGLKYKEIAEQLDISPKTVENHMGSAIKFLRTELKDYIHLFGVFVFIHGIGDKLF